MGLPRPIQGCIHDQSWPHSCVAISSASYDLSRGTILVYRSGTHVSGTDRIYILGRVTTLVGMVVITYGKMTDVPLLPYANRGSLPSSAVSVCHLSWHCVRLLQVCFRPHLLVVMLLRLGVSSNNLPILIRNKSQQ